MNLKRNLPVFILIISFFASSGIILAKNPRVLRCQTACKKSQSVEEAGCRNKNLKCKVFCINIPEKPIDECQSDCDKALKNCQKRADAHLGQCLKGCKDL